MSLKYLIPSLQTLPQPIPLSEEEFGRLLNDVVAVGKEKIPPQKAHDEFLLGCERMLVDICKAYPTEAEPFMKPVTKKIAPDYDKVISEPMDIGTMHKKIKSKEYRNKAMFARDLTLIWENCLKYNADPHPVRTHAQFMQRLATHHLRYLPDKSDVMNASLPEGMGGGKKGSGGGVGVGLLSIGNGVGLGLGTAGGATGVGEGTATGREGDGQDASVGDAAITGYRAPAVSVGKTRAILSDGHSLLVNRKRLVTLPPVDDPKRRKLDPPAWFPAETVVPTDKGGEDEAWWTEAAPAGTVLPREPPASAPLIRTPAQPNRVRSRPSESLSHRISQNITLMHNMRETASLLSAIATGSMEDHPAAEKDLKDHSMRVREFKRARTRSDKVIDEGVASSQLRMATGVMLSHAGFEGCNSIALDFVTRIASDYLMGLGKTATLFTDRVTKKDHVSAANVLEMVLGNNGNVSLKELDNYVKDDVFRYGAKLEDMHKKLRQALDEQVEPDEDDDEIGEDDLLFGGIPGMGDMDDFLGLGGIGSIPKKLLRDRKSKVKSEPKEPEAPPLEYPGPPPLLPLTLDDIPFQIGLLRSYYTEKAEQETGLADQDWDPTMTQVGAFGQVVVRGTGGQGKKMQEKKEERKAKREKKRPVNGPGMAGAPEEPFSPEPEA